MALSIKTEEADRLARELSRRTGETMTEAVTIALRERLGRVEKSAPDDRDAQRRRLDQFLDGLEGKFDRRPVTKAEWEDACGDDIG